MYVIYIRNKYDVPEIFYKVPAQRKQAQLDATMITSPCRAVDGRGKIWENPFPKPYFCSLSLPENTGKPCVPDPSPFCCNKLFSAFPAGYRGIKLSEKH